MVCVLNSNCRSLLTVIDGACTLRASLSVLSIVIQFVNLGCICVFIADALRMMKSVLPYDVSILLTGLMIDCI